MKIDILKDTLSKVNDWIKFAEAKNAANVAFSSASIFALMRFIASAKNINQYVEYYLYFCTILLGISLLISILSFVPKLSPPWVSCEEKNKDDNFLYFGHACKYNSIEYLELLYNGNQKSESYLIELAYSGQIVVNSKIAFIKFKQFDFAIWFVVAVLITPIGALIVRCKTQI